MHAVHSIEAAIIGSRNSSRDVLYNRANCMQLYKRWRGIAWRSGQRGGGSIAGEQCAGRPA